MATKLPDDLQLRPLDGEARDLSEWLTTFHLASVVLDPYTNESSWVLKSAVRILEEFRGSHARVNFVVTASDDDSCPEQGVAASASAFAGGRRIKWYLWFAATGSRPKYHRAVLTP